MHWYERKILLKFKCNARTLLEVVALKHIGRVTEVTRFVN